MKKYLLATLMMVGSINVSAQWQMQPTPNDTLQPVRNLGGGKVAFSIYAPNAKEVGFGGDAMPWGKPLQFTKADNGVWTAVISDLKDGVYRYNFTVDGVKVQDPKGALSAETSALANIGDGKQFYDMLPSATTSVRHSTPCAVCTSGHLLATRRAQTNCPFSIWFMVVATMTPRGQE